MTTAEAGPCARLRWLWVAILLIASASLAQPTTDQQPPQDPLGRDTPRGTIVGFLKAVDDGDVTRAAQFLDLRNLPDSVARYEPEQIARGMAIVLQRGLWIDVDNLSDSPDGRAGDGLPSYRDALGQIEGPNGEMTLLLQRVPGDGGGFVWKFSNATVARLPELYQRYRYNPYVEWLSNTVPNGSVLGLEYYKWIGALSITAAAAPIVLLLAWLLSRLIIHPSRPLHKKLRRLLLGPMSTLILVLIADGVLTSLGLGYAAQQVARANTLLIAASLWLISGTVTFAREAYALFLIRRGRESSIPLLRPLASALRVIFMLLGVMMWLDNLGYEVTALLTGLGIGGVAVALVLQKPLEDVFGAITLYTQQPIRIGDFGRFGPYTGTVEEISLRTTRIRTLDNTVIAVPNMKLAGEPIENYSARRKILYAPALRLHIDTTREQLEPFLDALRALLAADPQVLEEGARVRFTHLGNTAFEVRVFAYVNTTEFARFLEIAERLNLAVLQCLDDNGVRLASPLADALESGRS